MIKSDHIDRMRKIMGKDNVLTSKEELITYSYDATHLWSHMPNVVALPANTKQISGIMKLANGNRIPVTPRGGGTNISGGSVPIKGGIVLCTTGMNRIIEINRFKSDLERCTKCGSCMSCFVLPGGAS